MNRFLVALGIGIVIFGSVFAFKQGKIDRMFLSRANALYRDAKYDDALKAYEELETSILPYQSPELFYNKGNCFFRMGEYPRALLFYLKARKLAPRDKEIENNIRITQMQLGIKPLAKGVVYNFLSYMRMEEWAILLTLFIWFLIFFALGKDIPHNVKVSFIALFSVLSICAFTGVLLYIDIVGVNRRLCIEDAHIYSGPSDKETDLGEMKAGTLLKELKSQGQWTKVYIENKKETGWIEMGKTEKI